MRRLLIAVVLAAEASTCVAGTTQVGSRRDVTVSRCEQAVGEVIYTLAKLEWIEIKGLVDAKKGIEVECRKLSDERIENMWNGVDPDSRVTFGQDLAATAFGIGKDRRDATYHAGLEIVRKYRGPRNGAEAEDLLAEIERLRNPPRELTEVERAARKAKRTAQSFIDSCARGFEVTDEALKLNKPTEKQKKANAKNCAGLYRDFDTRKEFEAYDDWYVVGNDACLIGAGAALTASKITEITNHQLEVMKIGCRNRGRSAVNLAEAADGVMPANLKKWRDEENAEWAKLRAGTEPVKTTSN